MLEAPSRKKPALTDYVKPKEKKHTVPPRPVPKLPASGRLKISAGKTNTHRRTTNGEKALTKLTPEPEATFKAEAGKWYGQFKVLGTTATGKLACECICGAHQSKTHAQLHTAPSCRHYDTDETVNTRERKPFYLRWRTLLNRAIDNPDSLDPAWRSFETFYEDLHLIAKPKHQLLRLNPLKPWCKSNAIWVPRGHAHLGRTWGHITYTIDDVPPRTLLELAVDIGADFDKVTQYYKRKVKGRTMVEYVILAAQGDKQSDS
ncbi:hypothetical protein [Vibrio phage LV6]|nr:hypothetical protein [Vibrio phage LV6]